MGLRSYSTDGRKWFVKLGYGPVDTDPRIGDHIGRFKIGLIGMIGLQVAPNTIVCFGDSFLLKGSGGVPKEI